MIASYSFPRVRKTYSYKKKECNVRSKSVLLNACNILMQEVPSFQFHKLFMGLLSEGSQANTRRGSILTTDKDHLLNKKAD